MTWTVTTPRIDSRYRRNDSCHACCQSSVVVCRSNVHREWKWYEIPWNVGHLPCQADGVTYTAFPQKPPSHRVLSEIEDCTFRPNAFCAACFLSTEFGEAHLVGGGGGGGGLACSAPVAHAPTVAHSQCIGCTDPWLHNCCHPCVFCEQDIGSVETSCGRQRLVVECCSAWRLVEILHPLPANEN